MRFAASLFRNIEKGGCSSILFSSNEKHGVASYTSIRVDDRGCNPSFAKK